MTNRKRFDAVKMMRSIRDGLSKELINMDYTEQKNYIVQALKRKPLKHKSKRNEQLPDLQALPVGA